MLCNCMWGLLFVALSLSVFFSVSVVIPVIHLCRVVYKDNFELASLFIIKCRSVIWFLCKLSAFNFIACTTPLRCFLHSHHVLSLSCMLFKACIPAYEWICCVLSWPWWLWLRFLSYEQGVCVKIHWAAWTNRLQAWETHGYVCALCCLNGWSLSPPLLLGGSESAISDVSRICHSHLVFILGLYLLIYHFTFWFPYFLLFIFLGYQLQVPSISTTSSRWSWDHEEERRRQEKWQIEQERLLQVPPNHINALFDSWFLCFSFSTVNIVICLL